ncbi:acyltransferase family protein [Glycomyces salinus]|uniref:acyltransferase family protein n=1 Tax=Glycomyces salinus TaxID=980294 RepID=UPI0018EA9D3C|nr:acyltransferase family protein [Glycomyces salinus]
MTAPEPPRPRSRTASGTGVDEETLHLPLAAPGATARPTAPSPYPPRAPFQPPPAPSAAPRPPRQMLERWEGTGFRPDIQGLRAVAVMLVLLSHAGFAFASGGYVGVDVFFVISGFLITSLLVKELFDTGRISLAGFFSRRARRILPAATVVTIATVVGVWLWFPITRFEEVMRDAFTVVTYVVNYRFVVESNEYLNADQMPSPFQQYWSLAVEEQFYLIWPLLLLALLIWCKRVPRKALNAAIALTVAVFVLSLIASVLVTESSRPTAYYATHTRAWELAGGALLALTLPTWKKIPQAVAFLLGLAGLAAIAAAAYTYDDQTAFPGYTALLPVAGTMLLIVAGTGKGANHISALLSTGPFQFVGKLSYSLYLWHWPVLILAPLALGIESSLLLNVILLAGTFALAQLSYQYIETPIRTAKPLKTNHFWGLATGVACSLLAIATVITVTVTVSRSPDATGPVDLADVQEAEDLSAIELALSDGLEIQKVPDDLTPPLAGVADDVPRIYSDGCHLDFGDVELSDGCVYGDPDSETEVVLVGDSHAAQWFPALDTIASEQGWKLLNYTKSGCTPVSVRTDNDDGSGEYTECWEWKQVVFDEIDRIRPDLVVLSSSNASIISGLDKDEGTDEWRRGWVDTLDRVSARSESVTVLTDTPRASGTGAPDCLALNPDDVQHCLETHPYTAEHAERRQAVLNALEQTGVEAVRTSKWFCVDGGCPLIVDDLLLYRDTHHITTPYARSLSNVLFEALPDI